MKYIKFIILCILFNHINFLLAQNTIENYKIWSGEPYASFTTLSYYNNKYYCAFRNAATHLDSNGTENGNIIIICSADAITWDFYDEIKIDDFDLRDPKLSITPENKLMLLFESVKVVPGNANIRKSLVSFKDQEANFSEPISINIPNLKNNWLWSVYWYNATAYGFNYISIFSFYKSSNGIDYSLLENLELPGNPTEGALCKLNDSTLLSIVRTSGNSLLGIYDIKKNVWKWDETAYIIQCPILLEVNDNIYLAGRLIENNIPYIALFSVDNKTNKIVKLLSIKVEKDCGYPGMVFNNDTLYISYYSGNYVKSSIYLMSIKLNK